VLKKLTWINRNGKCTRKKANDAFQLLKAETEKAKSNPMDQATICFDLQQVLPTPNLVYILYGWISACIDPEVTRSRSQGYKLSCCHGHA